ncbi:MAG: GNAT family N-acetyltransferase [Nocardioides sp.]
MKLAVRPLELGANRALGGRWVEVHHAAHRALFGPRSQRTDLATVLATPVRRGEEWHCFAGYAGERLVGAGAAITSTQDNRHVGNQWLSVHPDFQRRGLGSMLLERIETDLAERGCTQLLTHAGEPDPEGCGPTAFALARGFRQTHLSLRLTLDLTLWRPQPGEPGGDPAAYEILTAADQLPEEWLEDRAYLARRMSTDAPLGEVDLDEEDWDADRLRERWSSRHRVRNFEAVARDRESGRLVGYTDLTWNPASPWLFVQTDTLVLREHRGRGLGGALKVANLLAACKLVPEADTVETWNSESNDAMLTLNRRLGFTVSGWTRDWFKTLPR